MREPDLPRPFKVPLYPLPLIVFSVLSLWTLVHLIDQRPVEGLLALALIAAGLLFYYLSQMAQTRKQNP
jgi:APA family basic amino acid/polyamine antiporter